MTSFKLPGTLAMAATAAALAFGAAAQEYPSQAITLVVPYPPGGQIDFIARLMQPGLQENLGQPVVVENRPGASGMLGSASVFRGTPDGYTFVLTTNAVMALNPLLYADANYDPIADATPVSVVSESYMSLTVNSASEIQDFPGLLTFAAANPGEVTFGSPGSPQQIVGALVGLYGNVELTDVPYSGIGPAITDVMGGHITMGIGTIASMLPHVQSGALRFLAITGPERLDSLPDVPTVNEFLPGIIANTWAGYFAPANTPEPIVARLNEAIVHVLQDPEVRGQLEARQEMIRASSPAAAGELVATDLARWTSFLEQVEITVD